MDVRTVEAFEDRDSITHLRQALSRCRHGKGPMAQFVFDPGPAGTDAHLEATIGQHRQ
jgi:hypothetical protein